MTNCLRWIQRALGLIAALCCFCAATASAGSPPAQRLPSALLIFPLVDAGGDRDTRIELVNLSANPLLVQCFYVEGESCNEIGFFVFLTPRQPLAWLASAGLSDPLTGSASPPFFGTGEMKCAVVPERPEIEFHNALQGRATVFRSDGRTVSYGAAGFRRLTDGEFSGVVALNGTTYAQCPEKLHFDVLTDQPTASSEMILLPCSQDLLLQIPTSITVQFQVINEFEQVFSASTAVKCFARRTLGDITDTLTRNILGTDTAHVVVRGSNGPLVGLVIDTVTFAGITSTAGNEPSFQGGRSATVIFP